MNQNEMQELIAAHQQAESKREQDSQTKLELKIEKYQKELYSWNDKVREWICNVQMLRQNGYKFYTVDDKSIYNLSESQEKFAICTDTIRHTFGPWNVPKFLGKFGMAAGGALGDWHIVTDGNSWWIQCGSNTAPLRLNDYQWLLDKYDSGHTGVKTNAIERFEKRWNELIDYLKTNS